MVLMLPFYFAAGFSQLANATTCRETTEVDSAPVPLEVAG
jgi:hypothetical protein